MRDDILDKILEILNINIENAEFTPEHVGDDLSTIGMDSIIFIRVIVALEDEFDIEIPDEYLLLTELNTISKMVDVISAVLGHENNAIGE